MTAIAPLPHSTVALSTFHHRPLAGFSEYFRSYLATLQPLVEAKVEAEGAGRRKKQKVATAASFQATQVGAGSRCSGHSPLQHCIDLPDQCGFFASGQSDMELFLQHLYFATTFHLPPTLPKAELIAAVTSLSSPSLVFPAPIPSPSSYAARSKVNIEVSLFSEPLLSFFHPFRCLQALRRCEEVVLHDVLRCRRTPPFHSAAGSGCPSAPSTG